MLKTQTYDKSFSLSFFFLQALPEATGSLWPSSYSNNELMNCNLGKKMSQKSMNKAK